MGLEQDLQFACYICPICHQGSFREHWMVEYAGWNKCSSCGSLEHGNITKSRMMLRLAPDKVSDSFIDPVTPKIASKSLTIGIYNESNSNTK